MAAKSPSTSFMGIPVSAGVILSVAALLVISSGTIVSQTKTFVLSREEGDAMKARITVVEAGYAKLNEKMDANRKEIQENLEKSQKTLKEELMAAIKDLNQNNTNSQAFLVQRIGEIRSSQIENTKELREKIDAVAYGAKRPK